MPNRAGYPVSRPVWESGLAVLIPMECLGSDTIPQQHKSMGIGKTLPMDCLDVLHLDVVYLVSIYVSYVIQ